MTNVLVVEDDPLNTELMLEIHNVMGFTAHNAMNGEEAIKKTENNVYDLVLMDIALPGMNGIEATRIIKSKPAYKNVPIVALTACVTNRERFIKAGFEDYISKPIDVSGFMKRLERFRK